MYVRLQWVLEVAPTRLGVRYRSPTWFMYRACWPTFQFQHGTATGSLHF